jgi:hypothetical protein
MKFYLCDSDSVRLSQLDREIGIRRAHPDDYYPENALDDLYKKWLAGVQLFQAATTTAPATNAQVTDAPATNAQVTNAQVTDAPATFAPAANSILRTISAAAAEPELEAPVTSATDRTLERSVWHGIPQPLPQKFRDLRSQAAQRLCDKYERLRVECRDVSAELEAIYHASIARPPMPRCGPRVVSCLRTDSEVESLMVTVPSTPRPARFIPSPYDPRPPSPFDPSPPSPVPSPAPPRRAMRGTVHPPGPGYRAGSYKYNYPY